MRKQTALVGMVYVDKTLHGEGHTGQRLSQVRDALENADNCLQCGRLVDARARARPHRTLSWVAHPATIEFVRSLNPEYRMPARRTVNNWIELMFQVT